MRQMSRYSAVKAAIFLSNTVAFFSYLYHRQFLNSSDLDADFLVLLVISRAQCFLKCPVRTLGLFAAPHETVVYHLEEMCVKFNSQPGRQTSPAERKKNVQTLESRRRPTELLRTAQARQPEDSSFLDCVTLKRKTTNLWLLTLQQQEKAKSQLHQNKNLHPKDWSNLS